MCVSDDHVEVNVRGSRVTARWFVCCCGYSWCDEQGVFGLDFDPGLNYAYCVICGDVVMLKDSFGVFTPVVIRSL